MVEKRVAELTEYQSPDGEVFRFYGANRFLLTEEGYGMPGIEYIQQKGPFQHGSTYLDYRLQPRVIQWLYREQSCSREEWWNIRSGLLNYLRPNRQAVGSFSLGTLVKELTDGSQRAIDVALEQGPTFVARNLETWDEWAIQETIRFIAPDPTFYDPDQKQALWSIAGPTGTGGGGSWTTTTELIFPITFPILFGTVAEIVETGTGAEGEIGGVDFSGITYPGTWHSYPVITLTGPMDGPVINNITLGQKITLLTSISSGEVITIDLSYGHKTVESSTRGNMIGSVTEDSDLATWRIAPEPEAPYGNNVIYITATDVTAASNVTMDYYIRYVGI